MRTNFVSSILTIGWKVEVHLRSQIVWLKRDLRISDNAALAAAVGNGPIALIYVFEPEYWKCKDLSYRHYVYIKQCLEELTRDINGLRGSLQIFTGDIIDILSRFRSVIGEFDLWAHEETGNYWSYERDKKVRNWCKHHNIRFTEKKQFGVWRGAELNRNIWAKNWAAMMQEPLVNLPRNIDWIAPLNANKLSNIPDPSYLELVHDGIKSLQQGGRSAAVRTLTSFLYERGRNYRTDMSSPILGENGCSRLSTHIALGSLSIREIYQATIARKAELQAHNSPDAKAWRASLTSFIGRLHWHCHFIQKLELEPELEWLPMARSYYNIRSDYKVEYLHAFEHGETGFPFVDACMRSLKATGWINFRMRAMLMSFASYNLWLPWQKSGEILARFFTDYEPGIHWTQSQMQSGETGINSLRIYSPVKQGYDHDPDGTFIKLWVPELATLAGNYVHEPWLGNVPDSYPERLVDHVITAKKACEKIWSIKRTPVAKKEAARVYDKHGSRRRSNLRRQAASKRVEVDG